MCSNKWWWPLRSGPRVRSTFSQKEPSRRIEESGRVLSVSRVLHLEGQRSAVPEISEYLGVCPETLDKADESPLSTKVSNEIGTVADQVVHRRTANERGGGKVHTSR